MSKILLYTQSLHPRLLYTLDFIRQFTIDYDWKCTDSFEEYLSHPGISVNYSNISLKENEYPVYNAAKLTSEISNYSEITSRHSNTQWQLFPNENDDRFDVFAAIFYVIARVEEYRPFIADVHGRYPSHESILHQGGVLQIAIVDHWVINLIKELEIFFKKNIPVNKSQTLWSLGIDVDHFYKHRYKSLYKKCGGIIKSFIKFEGSELYERIMVLLNQKKDPYDVFDKIKELEISSNQFFYFILSANNSVFDKNQSLQLPTIKLLVKNLSLHAQIGLHPSYEAGTDSKKIMHEKKALEEVTGQPLYASRFHYLRLRFPESYRALISNNILRDYSLGYADFPGFRAGTCRSYYWYDLKLEKQTDLKIIPLIVMDRSYLDYLKFDPDKTVHSIKMLFDECKNTGGHFHFTWHNSSFDFENEWKGWEHVLTTLVAYFKNNEEL